jgi:hypothetical protein
VVGREPRAASSVARAETPHSFAEVGFGRSLTTRGIARILARMTMAHRRFRLADDAVGGRAGGIFGPTP